MSKKFGRWAIADDLDTEGVEKEVEKQLIEECRLLSMNEIFFTTPIANTLLKQIKYKVVDYCNIEAVTPPLYDFIQKKMLDIAEKSRILDSLQKNTQDGDVYGIDINKVKSINRGDTSITLKDEQGTSVEQAYNNYLNAFELSGTDYIVLNRHRKVFK